MMLLVVVVGEQGAAVVELGIQSARVKRPESRQDTIKVLYRPTLSAAMPERRRPNRL